MYYPTIHHVYFLLEKNCHPGCWQGHERRPLLPGPCKSSGGLCSILFILIKILFILINPSCPRVLVSQHKQQSTIIWLGITRLGSAQWRDALLNEQRVLPFWCVPQAQVSWALLSPIVFSTPNSQKENHKNESRGHKNELWWTYPR